MSTQKDQNVGGATAKWTFTVIDKDGKVKEEKSKTNLIVNAGLEAQKDYMFNGSTSVAQFGWIAVGTNATAATATDVLLGTETAREAVENYTAGGTGVCTIDNTFAAGVATGTITEAGIFNVVTADTATMYNHVVFAGVTKGASDTLKVSVTITFTAV